jgi:murein DD-endopeptidase MepM/ murein hydrolase activator NlpD
VYYVHANNALAEGTSVSLGDVVAVSGASNNDDGTTYAHLHLEIRNEAEDMVYNPIYFFAPNTWNSMNLTYMDYRNSYESPETRIYGIELESGNNYWNGPPYPIVLVR